MATETTLPTATGSEATTTPRTETTTAAVERTQWAAIVTLAVASLVVASESSMAAIALPLIGVDLGMGASTTAWVLLAYSVPLAALAIPAGRWVDRADVRLVFVFSLVSIGLASVIAALAPSFWVLMIGRVLQGFAAAIYLAISLPVVAAAVREDQRGRAMSYVSTIMLVGSMAVTPLGGFVAAAFGWREVFLAKLPLLALVLWLGTRTIPAGGAGVDAARRLPLPDRSLLHDVVLVGGAMTALLLAFGQVEGSSWLVTAVLALAAVALAAWWTRLPATEPVMALVRRLTFGLPVLALALMASLIGLVVFLLPFFIADVMQRGPELLGIVILFFVATSSVVTPIAGMLADRLGPHRVAPVGGALTVAGMLTMLTLNADAGLLDIAWRMGAVGIGMSLFNSPNMTAILNATPAGQAGTAGGVTSFSRTLGTTIGPAVAALAWSLAGGGTAGFRTGTLVLTAFAIAGSVALVAARRRDP